MSHYIQKIFFCLALVICVRDTYGQVLLLGKAIDKIEGAKNISYRSIEMFKNPAADDTTVYQNNAKFLKTPADSIYGYLFKINQKELVGLFKGAISSNTYDGHDIT